jgi:hypothetical protein
MTPDSITQPIQAQVDASAPAQPKAYQPPQLRALGTFGTRTLGAGQSAPDSNFGKLGQPA